MQLIEVLMSTNPQCFRAEMGLKLGMGGINDIGVTL